MCRKLALLLSALLLICTFAGCYNLDTEDYIAPTPVLTLTPTVAPIPAPIPTTSDGSLDLPVPKNPKAVQLFDYMEDYQDDDGSSTMWYDEENDWYVRLNEYVPPYADTKKVFQIGDEVVHKEDIIVDGELRKTDFSYKVNSVTITQNREDLSDMLRWEPGWNFMYDPNAPETYTLREYYYYLVLDITITNLSDIEAEKYLNTSRFCGMNENLAIIAPYTASNSKGISDFYVGAEAWDANISQNPNTNGFFQYIFQPGEALTIRLLTFINDKAITDYDLCYVPYITGREPGADDDLIIIHKRSELP